MHLGLILKKSCQNKMYDPAPAGDYHGTGNNGDMNNDGRGGGGGGGSSSSKSGNASGLSRSSVAVASLRSMVATNLETMSKNKFLTVQYGWIGSGVLLIPLLISSIFCSGPVPGSVTTSPSLEGSTLESELGSASSSSELKLLLSLSSVSSLQSTARCELSEMIVSDNKRNLAHK